MVKVIRPYRGGDAFKHLFGGCSVMRDRSVPWVIPIFLTLLMLGMSASFFVKPPQSASLQDNPTHYVGLNQPTNLEISTPNGSSSALKAEVPVGHTVGRLIWHSLPMWLHTMMGSRGQESPIGTLQVQFWIESM